MIAFVGLLVAYILLLRFAPMGEDPSGSLAHRKSESLRLLAITLAQGVIGYTQYFTGVPEALVLAHLIGVVLLWSTLIRHALRSQIFEKSAGRVAPGAPLAG